MGYFGLFPIGSWDRPPNNTGTPAPPHRRPCPQFLAADLGALRYPQYQVHCACRVFDCRQDLLGYERALGHAAELADALEASCCAVALRVSPTVVVFSSTASLVLCRHAGSMGIVRLLPGCRPASFHLLSLSGLCSCRTGTQRQPRPCFSMPGLRWMATFINRCLVWAGQSTMAARRLAALLVLPRFCPKAPIAQVEAAFATRLCDHVLCALWALCVQLAGPRRHCGVPSAVPRRSARNATCFAH